MVVVVVAIRDFDEMSCYSIAVKEVLHATIMVDSS
jgi:hypothetical protein